jgi:hypothetical protein
MGGVGRSTHILRITAALARGLARLDSEFLSQVSVKASARQRGVVNDVAWRRGASMI